MQKFKYIWYCTYSYESCGGVGNLCIVVGVPGVVVLSGVGVLSSRSGAAGACGGGTPGGGVGNLGVEGTCSCDSKYIWYRTYSYDTCGGGGVGNLCIVVGVPGVEVSGVGVLSSGVEGGVGGCSIVSICQRYIAQQNTANCDRTLDPE